MTKRKHKKPTPGVERSNRLGILPRLESVFVYLVECKDNTIYTGITNNINRRMNQHKGRIGGGATYTKDHGFRRLLMFRKFATRGLAMKEERRIKDKLSHRQKRDLVHLEGWIDRSNSYMY